MRDYSYYPGCSLKATGADFDLSFRYVARALGIDLREIRDWVCCGASSAHATSHLQSVALPVFTLAKAEEVPLIIQVNGKLRDKIMVAPGIGEPQARRLALESPKTQAHLAGKVVAQCIYVPGKLINLVVK